MRSPRGTRGRGETALGSLVVRLGQELELERVAEARAEARRRIAEPGLQEHERARDQADVAAAGHEGVEVDGVDAVAHAEGAARVLAGRARDLAAEAQHAALEG